MWDPLFVLGTEGHAKRITRHDGFAARVGRFSVLEGCQFGLSFEEFVG